MTSSSVMSLLFTKTKSKIASPLADSVIICCGGLLTCSIHNLTAYELREWALSHPVGLCNTQQVLHRLIDLSWKEVLVSIFYSSELQNVDMKGRNLGESSALDCVVL